MKHLSSGFSSFRFRDEGFRVTAPELGGTGGCPCKGVVGGSSSAACPAPEMPARHGRATRGPGKAQGTEVVPRPWGMCR